MVNQFHFQKLTGADQIPRHFDVGLGRGAFAAYAVSGISLVIPHPVLCRMAHDLSDLDLVEPLSYAA